MIKSIVAGPGIAVQNAHTNWPSFYNNSASSNNTLVGQIRYNGSSQTMEVYDGMTWLSMSSAYPTIELSPHVQSVVDWAQRKMAEESRIRELAAKHPTVADALEAVRQAEEKVQVAAALCDIK